MDQEAKTIVFSIAPNKIMELHFNLFLLICSIVVWLGPFCISIYNRSIRLLHPEGFFPLCMSYLACVPFIYALFGPPILRTSQAIGSGSYFLARPYFILAIAGVFYHVGIKMSGLSLVPGHQDLLPYERMKSVLNLPAPFLFISSLIVALMVYTGMLFMDPNGYGQGMFWIYALYKSIYVLPILVLNQNDRFGALFLLCIIPLALVTASKAAFIYIAFALVLFYQSSIFKRTRLVAFVVIFAVISTPFAVARYSKADFQIENVLNTDAWKNSVQKIAHREYAFEAFACVCQYRLNDEPFYYGEKIVQDLSHIIPAAFWPNKPIIAKEFPSNYLPADLWNTAEWVGYTQHLFTPAYLDFGIPGVCVLMMMVGFAWGIAYKKARNSSRKKNECWPMILYLCFYLQSHWIIGAGISYGVPLALGTMTGILLSIGIAKSLSINHSMDLETSTT